MVAPLGGPRLPAPARVGLALLLAALAAPILVASAGAAALAAGVGRPRWRCCSRARCWSASVWGSWPSAAFRAAEIAGRLADTLRGANVAEVLVPTAEERSSPLGVLYLLLATLVFLADRRRPAALEALLDSYRVLPVGGGLAARLGATGGGRW